MDIFEDQLDIGRLVLMEQAAELLDHQLAALNRVVLRKGGGVRHADAEVRAKAEYKLFDERRRLVRRDEADKHLSALKQADGELPKVRPSRVGPQKP